MTTKHTPGPWTVAEVAPEFYRHGKYWVAYVDLGPHRTSRHGGTRPDAAATVAPCLGLEGQPINREVVEANAHLIAAAPDLLEALEAAHGWLVFVGTETLEPVRARCRAAIAKAKGQSSSTDTARATE